MHSASERFTKTYLSVYGPDIGFEKVTREKCQHVWSQDSFGFRKW